MESSPRFDGFANFVRYRAMRQRNNFFLFDRDLRWIHLHLGQISFCVQTVVRAYSIVPIFLQHDIDRVRERDMHLLLHLYICQVGKTNSLLISAQVFAKR